MLTAARAESVGEARKVCLLIAFSTSTAGQSCPPVPQSSCGARYEKEVQPGLLLTGHRDLEPKSDDKGNKNHYHFQHVLRVSE